MLKVRQKYQNSKVYLNGPMPPGIRRVIELTDATQKELEHLLKLGNTYIYDDKSGKSDSVSSKPEDKRKSDT